MENLFQELVHTILEEPANLEPIPVYRATNALGVDALTVGYDQFFLSKFLDYSTNLYLIFSSLAAKDEHGNFDSPIFQDEGYNYQTPIWQRFRESYEAQNHLGLTHVLFGYYRIKTPEDHIFTVTDKPILASEVLHFHKNGSVTVLPVSRAEGKKYQAMLDTLYYGRIRERVKFEEELLASRTSREEAIEYLQRLYSDETDRFNFGEDTFKFRQFNLKFLYTKEGLARFDDFYQVQYLPYHWEEKLQEECDKTSKLLEKHILANEDLHRELLFAGGCHFKTSFAEAGGCLVESDLIDERTGKQFSLLVPSQEMALIYPAVAKELELVFARRRQVRRANEVLHSLSARF